MERFIDLSHTVEDSLPVYPGDLKTLLTQCKYLSIHGNNDHRLEICMHSGTHIDTPMHLTESTVYVSDIPLEHFVGNGCFLDVRGKAVITYEPEYEHKVQPEDIVILYTGHDKKFRNSDYFKDYPVIDQSLAEFFIRKQVKIVGLDTPSPDKYPFNVHRMLLSNNILIMENLGHLHKLLNVDQFEVMAFPLKIKADASILRVVARTHNP